MLAGVNDVSGHVTRHIMHVAQNTILASHMQKREWSESVKVTVTGHNQPLDYTHSNYNDHTIIMKKW